MKKIITICLLIATTFTVKAQDGKPTKEQTISFMNRTLKSTIGFEGKDGKIVEIELNQNKYYLKTYYDLGGSGFYSNFISSEFPWESLIVDQFEVNGNNLRIIFSQNYRNKYKIDDQPEKEQFISSLDMTLPFDKIESFKKACLRLAEIAKEENKDPFQN
jgi:hypothetical protein